MAARRPFWKWHRWKSIGFCLWPPSTCIWNLKLKFQSKLDLCSGNHVVYRQTDRRTDGRTRWIQYTPPPTSLGGGINIDYGLSIWDCTTEVNLNRAQRIQNLLARIICNNFDYIHSRGIDLVRSLKLQTIRGRRDYFLCVLMFKCIHGLAPHYLSNDVTMHVDIHGYDTRSAENMDLYIPRCAKEIYKRNFLYKGSSLWNKLPPWVKESTSLNDFKHNYRLWNGWMHSEFIVPFICTSILYSILMLSFYQFCLQLDRYNHIRNLSQSYHDIDAFMYDLYLWMCIYVFFIFMYFTL